ncbi:hypothetical protein GCM10010166_29650 [Couchioplanes caeruleus subsp. azureus]|nr:hypothetical protein GCM10010166_29650 [Couchioplanes caeruleus subsp. azureus]
MAVLAAQGSGGAWPCWRLRGRAGLAVLAAQGRSGIPSDCRLAAGGPWWCLVLWRVVLRAGAVAGGVAGRCCGGWCCGQVLRVVLGAAGGRWSSGRRGLAVLTGSWG